MSSIQKNVKRIREQRQLSVRDLARIAGVSVSYVYAIESGNRGSHLDKLRKIAEALDVPVEALWEGHW